MHYYLVALALTVGDRQRVLAANDWFVPCLQGQCSWDLPVDSGASGNLQIWGPTTAISDITSAAGWQITHCDSEATAQDIQLVCANANSSCDHLFQGGAVDTIVRLPDECGPMPFARVANYWTNQSNTPSSRAVTARASDAKVHSLTLDTNFSAVSPSPNGSVYFTVQGLNGRNDAYTPAVHQRRWFSRRGFHGAPHHIHRRDFFGNILQSLENATAFNKTTSRNLKPFSFSRTENLFNTSITCPETRSSFTASVSLDVDSTVKATVSLGAVAAGTVVPPKISEFGLTLGLDGNVDAQFSISANLTGTVSSGAIPLFQIGIPGLSFPGILDIGPEFVVMGKVDADFALSNVDASVGVAYKLRKVATTFPPQSGSNGGSFHKGTSAVTVTAGPNITEEGASVSVTGHLIPQVDIGLSAFGNVASSTVFLNMDASMDLSVSANSGDAQACVDASTELAVNIGAQASFFDLFDASTGDTLFKKNFPLLQVRRPSTTRLPLASRR
ncbi:hypothetical protein V8E53_007475 [Lactarius tabidus]